MCGLTLKKLVAASVVLAGLVTASGAAAQSAGVAPTVIPLSGKLLAADGQPRTGTVVLAVSMYDAQGDPTPRFVESQTITLDATGAYSVQFGATFPDGLPQYLFTNAPGTRWVGVGVSGEPDPAPAQRIMLVSVPYAAKAVSAETLDGKPVGDFVLTSTFRDDVRTVLQDEGVRTSSSVGATAIAGSLNFLQKGDGAAGTLDSTVYESAGRVGVGTSAPAKTFHIFQSAFGYPMRLENTGGPIAGFELKNSGTGVNPVAIASSGNDFFVETANVERIRVTAAGYLGVGTGAPVKPLHVVNGNFGFPMRLENIGGSISGFELKNTQSGANPVAIGANGNNFFIETNNTERMRISSAGDVGIGTNSPTSKLHVVGNAMVSGDMTVNGNIAAKYQDVAEWVDAKEPLEPGTVVVIDTVAKNRVMAAGRAYDSRVAGAVSPQPGLILGEPGEGKALVAQSGRVRIKVDARYGAIKAGDLLVTSPTKGHAMRSRPLKFGDSLVHRPGTLIGKALEGLDRGQGEILVLLTLQ